MPKATGQQPPANPYAPSVPISLYREVAAELQATRATLDALKNQNQQLVKQNQQLRQEIEKVVQSALQLRQVTSNVPSIDWESLQETLRVEPQPEEPSVSANAPAVPARTKAEPPLPSPIKPENLFTEQESQPRRQPTASERPDLGGWWLAAVIFLIVVTAFGTGFLIVKPLLPSR